VNQSAKKNGLLISTVFILFVTVNSDLFSWVSKVQELLLKYLSRAFLPRLYEGWNIPAYERFSSKGLNVHAGPPLIPMKVHVVAHVKTTDDFLNPQSLILNPKSSNLISPSSNKNPPTKILHFQSSNFNPYSSILHPQFIILQLQSSTPQILIPSSLILNPQSSLLDPQSLILNPQILNLHTIILHAVDVSSSCAQNYDKSA
jgi:hypothetical protein